MYGQMMTMMTTMMMTMMMNFQVAVLPVITDFLTNNP
jgi:hypothetical protein